MNSPMISVIVPIYNVEKYLKRCLDSIKNQTYTDFEVVMVNDGSTDASADIAKQYLLDNRFKLFSQHNQGQGAARNLGIEMSRGIFICFVDSDDYVSTEYLAILLKTLKKYNADIVQCGVQRVWEDGRSVNLYSNSISYKEFADVKSYIRTAAFSFWDKLFKKELFQELRFPLSIKFEDFALAPQVYERAKKIVYVPDYLYFYLWRNNSTTNSVKIQPDILKAQHILEESDFGKKNNDILGIFFIRQIMGSFIWSMILCDEPPTKIKAIIKEGLRKYPDIRKSINNTTIGTGKALWGRLLIDGHYNLATIYAKLYNFSYLAARVIYRFLKK